MSLQIKNVRTGYGSGDVIDIDGYTFESGRITSILGNNGCGKSTLLKAMDAQLSYRGSVKVDGAEVSALAHAERAKMVAYLPQCLNPVSMSVRTLVSHGRFPYRSFGHHLTAEDEQIVDTAMTMVDIAAFSDRPVSDLSGGEMSRAYIAMVIAQKSRFVLLDEPAANLDIAHQIRLMEILQQLAAQGVGIVMTSHDIPLALTYSQALVLISGGKIIESGRPGEIASSGSLRCALGVGAAETADPGALFSYQLVR